jgi:hypothetical protein
MDKVNNIIKYFVGITNRKFDSKLIEQLIKKYTNDQDLGKAVRSYYENLIKQE